MKKDKYIITDDSGKKLTIDQAVISAFYRMHPVEAYDNNPAHFCNWMRANDYNLTDEEIKMYINSCR